MCTNILLKVVCQLWIIVSQFVAKACEAISCVKLYSIILHMIVSQYIVYSCVHKLCANILCIILSTNDLIGCVLIYCLEKGAWIYWFAKPFVLPFFQKSSNFLIFWYCGRNLCFIQIPTQSPSCQTPCSWFSYEMTWIHMKRHSRWEGYQKNPYRDVFSEQITSSLLFLN